jgi:hypothetical protein
MFFPQMLDWFSTIDTVVVGRLLQKWPTLELLQAAPVSEVAEFLSQHRIPDSRIIILQQLIGKAVPAIRDKAVLESSVLIVRRIVGQLEALREAITEHDRKIAALWCGEPADNLWPRCCDSLWPHCCGSLCRGSRCVNEVKGDRGGEKRRCGKTLSMTIL